jgi:hypothetical protein
MLMQDSVNRIDVRDNVQRKEIKNHTRCFSEEIQLINGIKIRDLFNNDAHIHTPSYNGFNSKIETWIHTVKFEDRFVKFIPILNLYYAECMTGIRILCLKFAKMINGVQDKISLEKESYLCQWRSSDKTSQK